ncbi:MAG: ABC transporter substrate-binding protein [Alphaproteobacteria bacterium]|nr:ABC transporter substrate-binding protein [Alphaproteobacteria bacterium]
MLPFVLTALAGELTYVERELPTRLSGLYASEGAELRVVDLVYERLFYWTTISSELRSRLVRRYELLEARTVLRLYLGDGAVFHDGRPVTAADVCFTVDAHRDPRNPLDRHERFREVVAGCAVGPEGTADVRLASPVVDARRLLDLPVLPAHRFAGTAIPADDPEWRQPLGSGPFALAAPIVAGEPLRFEARRSPLRSPELDAVTLVAMDGAVDALLAGDVHGVVEVPPADHARLVARDDVFVKHHDLRRVWFVAFDPSHARLKDPAVRRALDAAADRSAACASLPEGPEHALPLCEPVTGPFVPSSPYYRRDLAFTTGRATVGEPFAIRLGYDADADREAPGLVAALVERWAKAGARVEAVPVPHAEWGEVLREHGARGRFDAVLDRWQADLRDEVGPLLHGDGASNPFGWSDPEVDALLDRAHRATTDTEARDALQALHARVADARGFLFLYEVDVRSVWSERVQRSINAPVHYFLDVDVWRIRP